MTRTFSLHSVTCLLGSALIVGCAGVATNSKEPLTAKEQFFASNVKPILELNCLRCHNGATLPGLIDLSDKSTAFKPLKGSEPAIIPGNPDGSKLVTAISRKGTHRKMMPQLPISLTDDQIGVLREWIEDGAAWPSGKAGALKSVANPENP